MKQLQGLFLAWGILFLTLETVDAQGVINNYVVNLDAPPELRWTKVVEDYREIVQFAHSVIRSYVPEDLIPLVEEIGADIDNYIKQPYAAEMRGIARALNCSLGDVVLVNLIYDISAFCTSIVSQDDHGQIWHSRNLDYDFGSMLRNITVHVDFISQEQIVYSAITYAGYIGILSGQRPKAFSITVDERDGVWEYVASSCTDVSCGVVIAWSTEINDQYVYQRDQGSIFENILLAILDKRAVPMSFLVRDTLANEPDFESAINRLSKTDTVASVYFIIAGVNPGEGAVITKERLETIDIWRLDPAHGRWFEVETNYDHWTTPPPDDDRRDPANKAMTRLGQHNINKASLFAVMSLQPVLNNHTTYTVIMSPAQPQLMQAWIRNCC